LVKICHGWKGLENSEIRGEGGKNVKVWRGLVWGGSFLGELSFSYIHERGTKRKTNFKKKKRSEKDVKEM